MATGLPGSAYRMTGARLAVKRVFRDVASGAVDSCKGLAEAIEYVREGDTRSCGSRIAWVVH
jgi:hypothetical protein